MKLHEINNFLVNNFSSFVSSLIKSFRIVFFPSENIDKLRTRKTSIKNHLVNGQRQKFAKLLISLLEEFSIEVDGFIKKLWFKFCKIKSWNFLEGLVDTIIRILLLVVLIIDCSDLSFNIVIEILTIYVFNIQLFFDFIGNSFKILLLMLFD